MKIEVGSNITWVSAAGRLTGTVTNVTLSPSASGAVTPWIDVKYQGNRNVRLCALDSNLKMLKVEVKAGPTCEDMVERTNSMYINPTLLNKYKETL